MHVIQLPHHLDEYLPGLDVPLRPAEVVTAELPAGDVWQRLATLYALAGEAVAGAASRGAGPVVVVSGDCVAAPGGPGPAQVADALRLLLGTGRVAAVGIVCGWHPGRGAAARVGPHRQAALGSTG
jgi:hypothetical protein